jgi:hypothetical protein
MNYRYYDYYRYYDSPTIRKAPKKGCRARRRAKQNADKKTEALTHAIQSGHECPILCVSLTNSNAVVTDCCHVFSKEGLSTWTREHVSCPVCRRVCHV